MLNNPAARRVVAVAIDPPAKLLLRMHVSPDAVTVAGAVGASVVAIVLIPRDQLLWAVALLVVLALSDLLDGTMARLTGTSGPWGAFLDATLDRVTDAAVFGAMVVWSVRYADDWVWIPAVLTLMGVVVVPYAKARAEAVGARADGGIAERAERLVLLGIGAILSGLGVWWGLPAALTILAVLVWVTVLQRVVTVRRQLRGAPAGGDGDGAPA
jgi:CDP-diacylglycerol--glycerol-3-phosphate 3-phosphatidyltransferase